jgi:hypothetical protein
VSPLLEAEGGGVVVDGGSALRGSGVEVDSLTKRTAAARFEGGGVDVNSLSKRMVVACSEAGVMVVVCSGADDRTAACSGAEIKDGKWRW